MISDHTVREGLVKALEELGYIDITAGSIQGAYDTEHDKGDHDSIPDGCCGKCVVRELTNALNASGAA